MSSTKPFERDDEDELRERLIRHVPDFVLDVFGDPETTSDLTGAALLLAAAEKVGDDARRRQFVERAVQLVREHPEERRLEACGRCADRLKRFDARASEADLRMEATRLAQTAGDGRAVVEAATAAADAASAAGNDLQGMSCLAMADAAVDGAIESSRLLVTAAEIVFVRDVSAAEALANGAMPLLPQRGHATARAHLVLADVAHANNEAEDEIAALRAAIRAVEVEHHPRLCGAVSLRLARLLLENPGRSDDARPITRTVLAIVAARRAARLAVLADDDEHHIAALELVVEASERVNAWGPARGALREMLDESVRSSDAALAAELLLRIVAIDRRLDRRAAAADLLREFLDRPLLDQASPLLVAPVLAALAGCLEHPEATTAYERAAELFEEAGATAVAGQLRLRPRSR